MYKTRNFTIHELDRCHDRFHGLGNGGQLGNEKIFKPKKMKKLSPAARLALWHLAAYLVFVAIYYICF